MNPHYNILFEPQKIGPVTTPNRFYQVPHASGMTEANPNVRAAFRGTKAEGGWGVVSTGAVSIHPSSDDSPLPFARLWDDNDIKSHAMSTAAIHEHGSLAAVELWHGGGSVMNRTSRISPYAPSGLPWSPTHVGFMGQQKPRVMTKQDIKDVIHWQVEAAKRARSAEFDIVYIYAGMGYLGYQFLLPESNLRTDEYGGSVANRTRFVREMIEATKQAVGDTCAVALRISLEELRGKPSDHYASQAHEVVSLLSDMPDLWDVKMDSSPTDCGASRFRPEGAHEPVIDFVKSCTDVPVVGVGRFTSPDTMVSQIKRGVLDLVGAARASIADPFLPNKIREGREDEIRECIGCNICIASWHDGVPVRCTQNATAGEEWRKGWHPEKVSPSKSKESVLIVGGGPAGLEAGLIAARRGLEVTIVDAQDKLGGRVRFESGLPGLASWGRVVDYRLNALQQMANVSLFPASPLTVDDILEFSPDHVAIATGANWTRMRYSALELPTSELLGAGVFTPDDIAANRWPDQNGPVLVYDHDNYYLGGVLAEALADKGCEVIYATPAGHASAWTIMTNEQPYVHQALATRGIARHTLCLLDDFNGKEAVLSDIFSGDETRLAVGSVLVVGARLPNDELCQQLTSSSAAVETGLKSITAIGDAHAPGAIVHAVYSGHQFARNLDSQGDALYLRDIPVAENAPAAVY